MSFITTVKLDPPERMGSRGLPETPVSINTDRIEYFVPVPQGAAQHQESGSVEVHLSSGYAIIVKENMSSLSDKIRGTDMELAAGS